MEKRIELPKSIGSFFIALVLSVSFFFGFNLFQRSLEDVLFCKFEEKNIKEAALVQIHFYKILKESRKRREEKVLKDLENKKIKADSVLVVKILPSGERKFIVKKNIHKRHQIASLTKLMTALVVFDHYKLNSKITISKEAIAQEGDAGKLKPREKLRTKDLLYPMLIESSNDAAYALAEKIGLDKFVYLMNLEAKKIGLRETHYSDPTGEDDGNFSTAYDLVSLAFYILNYRPEIFDISKIKEKELMTPCPREPIHLCPHHYMKNTNHLLWEIPWVIGSKTGWTPEAKGCLIMVLKKDTDKFINVVIGSDDRFADMKKLIYYYNK